jgi:glutathione reductase (NADPH)
LSSDDFFALDTQPQRVAVVGSGYIAVELAGLLNAFDSRVEQLLRRDTVLRDFDALVQTALMREMGALGVVFQTGVTPSALAQGADGITLTAEGGRRLGPYDAVIWAIGREAATADLRLGRVRLGPRPIRLPADRYLSAHAGRRYLRIGDVTGRAALTPVAIAAGRRLADRLFGGRPERHLNYEFIPSVVFSHPPVGTVGLTEAQARTLHDVVEVKTTAFVPLYYALTEHRQRSEMKLVLAGDERRVIGCHIVGDGADEMLQGFAMGVRMGATLEDFQDTVAIHPTNAEEMVTMR